MCARPCGRVSRACARGSALVAAAGSPLRCPRTKIGTRAASLARSWRFSSPVMSSAHDVEVRHHARSVVFEDVAVVHPFAGSVIRDGRADSQWGQALGPLESAVEHGGTRTQYAHVIAKHYRSEYESEFGDLPSLVGLPERAGPVADTAARAAWERIAPARREDVSRVYANIGKAIAAYERRIDYAPSRFDRYVDAELAGKPHTPPSTLSADELHQPIQRRQAGRLRRDPLGRDRRRRTGGCVQDAVVARRRRARAVHARRPARHPRAGGRALQRRCARSARPLRAKAASVIDARAAAAGGIPAQPDGRRVRTAGVAREPADSPLSTSTGDHQCQSHSVTEKLRATGRVGDRGRPAASLRRQCVPHARRADCDPA
jgi:di-heme cytochrome c peroxidase